MIAFSCYLIRLSRWVGIQEVVDGPFSDSTPLFEENDPFPVRFHLKPLIWLQKEHGIPIHEDAVWNALSFTKGRPKNSSGWAVNVKGSLKVLPPDDAAVIVKLLEAQATNKVVYPLSVHGKLNAPTVSRPATVVVPEKVAPPGVEVIAAEAKESTRIQGLVADIGARMNFKVWLPKSDRSAVLKHCGEKAKAALLDELPLGYDADTMKTIRQIDVLWLKGKSIARAFEVEHTTAVYSGLLRMADLLALQPDINISLHIVAPGERQKKVFDEIKRPTFVGLELPERCTFIPYDLLQQLGKEKHLSHMTDSVLDEYAQYAPAE